MGDGVYEVIGVVKPIKRFGANMGFDWSGFALVPRTVIDLPPSMLLLVTEGAVFHADIQERTRRLLAGRHQFTEDFELFDFGTLIATLRTVFRALEWMLAMLVGIALISGEVALPVNYQPRQCPRSRAAPGRRRSNETRAPISVTTIGRPSIRPARSVSRRPCAGR